ncbi:hypothetical protein GLAREA_06587 [Glarea lozoyensis ATCC 20868]|uniref:Uncharacterized protein n=1 Tax=Glarea lozoyensis (strain ATCC 20868 / MF5171) TaxID=1116229 RepID=S3D8V2_GLAL2|nr:uncharacterized protein GLAREA_06587 [Glarea lozoyensis ATCC 20868]EPE33574.1 hypothetical protein GLAREA_06587 [Glarea lozoyensis ATCC 20868]
MEYTSVYRSMVRLITQPRLGDPITVSGNPAEHNDPDYISRVYQQLLRILQSQNPTASRAYMKWLTEREVWRLYFGAVPFIGGESWDVAQQITLTSTSPSILRTSISIPLNPSTSISPSTNTSLPTSTSVPAYIHAPPPATPSPALPTSDHTACQKKIDELTNQGIMLEKVAAEQSRASALITGWFCGKWREACSVVHEDPASVENWLSERFEQFLSEKKEQDLANKGPAEGVGEEKAEGEKDATASE